MAADVSEANFERDVIEPSPKVLVVVAASRPPFERVAVIGNICSHA